MAYAAGDKAENTCVGYAAGYKLTDGDHNSFLGNETGYEVTTGYKNVCIGYRAGNTITTGSDLIMIGQSTQPHAVDGYNQFVVGNGQTGVGNNQSKILTAFQSNNSSSWSTTSDRRIKKNIIDNTIGLDAIKQIKVRNFEYKTEEEIINDSPELAEFSKSAVVDEQGLQVGVIAQEIESILPDVVTTIDPTGVKSVNSDNLPWYLVNAVKELSAEVEALKSQINN